MAIVNTLFYYFSYRCSTTLIQVLWGKYSMINTVHVHTPLNVFKGGYLFSSSGVCTEFVRTSDRRNANVRSISCRMLVEFWCSFPHSALRILKCRSWDCLSSPSGIMGTAWDAGKACGSLVHLGVEVVADFEGCLRGQPDVPRKYFIRSFKPLPRKSWLKKCVHISCIFKIRV